jgi:predicted SAM-dependent methyltransferase
MKKLNLGCGTDYRKGWINLDISDKDIYGGKTKTDICHDLNKYPYPFKDKEFEEILSIGVLEHIQNLEKHIKELSRISKTNCLVKVHVPYFLSYYSSRELYTHKFSLNCVQLFNIFRRNGFLLKEKRLVIGFSRLFRWITPFVNSSASIQNFLERFPIIIPSAIEWDLVKNLGKI